MRTGLRVLTAVFAIAIIAASCSTEAAVLPVTSTQPQFQPTPTPADAANEPPAPTATPAAPDVESTPAQISSFPVLPAHPTLRDWPGFASADPIRLAWFYKQPADENYVQIAENFDFFIMTRRDEEDRDKLKFLGVKAPFFQYILLMEILDPGGCDERPFSNNVAYEQGDFCRIQQDHPDWFLRDSNGEPVTKDDKYYMDPGSEGFRQFWLERVRRSQETLGWDGIYIDNVYATLYKFEDRDITLEKYPDDASLQVEVEEFLRLIYEDYAIPAGRPVFANILPQEETEPWLRYMNYLDGAFVEAFAVDWDTDYLDAEDWEEQLLRFQKLQQEGKFLVLVSQSDNLGDVKRQEFALATYLLINEGTAFFRYGHHSEYRTARLYNNYALDLGQPLGPAEKDGDTWRREYTNGAVIVNPDTKEATIEVK